MLREPARLADAAIAVALALLVLVVHDVAYLLHQPYWLDESWVALSTRLPLRDVLVASGPSPLGWTLLLRLAPAGDQSQRWVPLLFAGLAVALGYAVVRSLGFGRAAAALTGGMVILVVPAMAVRDDLKQYTADTVVVLLLLLLVCRLEAHWSRRQLWWLAGVVACSPLLSSAAVFAGSAAFAALLLVAAGSRDGARVRAVLAAGAAAGAALVALLLATVLHNAGGAALRAFWVDAYLSRSPLDAAREVVHRAGLLVRFTGSPSLLLGTVLAGLGVWLVARSGRRATALLVPLAAAESAAAAMAHAYPFLDLRVSAWLLSTTALLMALGVAGTLRELVARAGGAAWSRAVAAAVSLLLAAAYLHECLPYARGHTIFAQDVRSQAAYVRANAQPGDVVLVTLSASWAFAYYDRDVSPRAVRSSSVATGFLVAYPPQARVVAMASRGPAAIESALRRAEALAADGTGHVWVVRTQIAVEEQPAWAALRARCGTTVVPVGVDPLLLDDTTHAC